EELIENYINRWYWNGLSINKALPWSKTFIEKHENRWKWNSYLGSLNRNESLPWSKELIEKYKDKWDYKSLIKNQYVLCKTEIIEICKDKWTEWDWKGSDYIYDDKLHYDEGLSGSKYLPWSEKLIEKYKDKWHWIRIFVNQEIHWNLKML